MDGASRHEHIAKRTQPGIGIGQMVQNARADHVRECFAEFGSALDGKLAYLEVGKRIYAF